jgi:hypothetical protein
MAAVIDEMIDGSGNDMGVDDRAELTEMVASMMDQIGQFIDSHRKPLVINAQDVVARERRRLLLPPMGPR